MHGVTMKKIPLSYSINLSTEDSKDFSRILKVFRLRIEVWSEIFLHSKRIIYDHVYISFCRL